MMQPFSAGGPSAPRFDGGSNTLPQFERPTPIVSLTGNPHVYGLLDQIEHIDEFISRHQDAPSDDDAEEAYVEIVQDSHNSSSTHTRLPKCIWGLVLGCAAGLPFGGPGLIIGGLLGFLIGIFAEREA